MITIKDEDGDVLNVELIRDGYSGGEENRLEVHSPIGAWLTRDQVRELLPALQRFADTGEIE